MRLEMSLNSQAFARALRNVLADDAPKYSTEGGGSFRRKMKIFLSESLLPHEVGYIGSTVELFSAGFFGMREQGCPNVNKFLYAHFVFIGFDDYHLQQGLIVLDEDWTPLTFSSTMLVRKEFE